MNEDQFRRKYIQAKKQNIVIISIFGILLIFALAAFGTWKYQHTYSAAKWNGDHENRYKIVNDMLEKNELIGMEEHQVIELLGNEDNNEQTSFKISKKNFPPETTLIYYLGVDFMDSSWLILSMEEGIVTEIFIDLT